MTTFKVPISDELLEVLDRDRLPGTMKVIRVDEGSVITGMRTMTVEDRDCPAELEGKTLTPIFRVEGLKVKIVGYDLLAI